MKCIKFENKFYIYQYLFAVVDYNHDIQHATLLYWLGPLGAVYM